MGLEFLTRVRRTSFLAGCLAAVLALALGSLPIAAALFAGTLASLVNLRSPSARWSRSPGSASAPACARARRMRIR
jgi:hypothetical protein